MSRTYNPLPVWPTTALAVAVFLAPGRHLRLSLGVLGSGLLVGPMLGRILVARTLRGVWTVIDDNLSDLGPDETDPA